MSIQFIYGRPVRPGEFLNRESELRTIFNRLHNGESTAVIGEPHIGKTSLLLQLADKTTQQANLGDDARSLTTSLLDLHPISNDYSRAVFWEEALDPLRQRPGHVSIARQLEQVVSTGFARRSLERLFNHLGERRQRLLLILDEFERLLGHPNFQEPAFFALLRSLATCTGGLTLVIASRLSVDEMNEQGRGLLESGSPFFNNMIGVRLRPFNELTVNALLDRAGRVLSLDDRRFIRRVAGRHPFMLQAMIATILETGGDDHQALAAETFYERICFHFDDTWRSLNDTARTTALILSLVELGGRALGENFAYGEIERVDSFGPELQRLAEQGLAEKISDGWQFDTQHLLLWRGERWTIGAQSFAWWVRDVVIAGARQVPTYDDWLANKRYRFLLTKEQWDGLLGAVHNMPDWAIRGVGGLARALLDELVRKK